MSDKCAICGVAAELKCGGCKLVVYCGRDHQKLHWKSGHKSDCKCYKVVSNPTLGRHVIATRDIRRGDVILREHPIVLGPKLVSEPMCLGCSAKLPQPPTYHCSQCQWPLCGQRCESNRWHQLECGPIARAKLPCPITGASGMQSGYGVIVPLRCWLLQHSDPKAYAKLLEMEDHLEQREKTRIYEVLRVNLCQYVQQQLKLPVDSGMLMRYAAILDTNCFEIRPHGQTTKVRAIFLETAMMSHDCTPNTRHVFDKDNGITVLATVDIPKGELVTVTYTQLLKSTVERREHLLAAKCFRCVCARCSDPTELGTFCGSIVCSRCGEGMMVSDDPLEEKSAFRCNREGCGHEVAGRSIEAGNRTLRKELQEMSHQPKDFERYLQQYERTLHGRNTHVLQVKYALIQQYGNLSGFRLHELNNATLERKITLCNDLLEVADIIEPGSTLFRGKVLLDLQQVMTLKTKREFEAQLITKDKAQEQLAESMRVLQEAVEILKVEPDMPDVLDERIRSLVAELEE